MIYTARTGHGPCIVFLSFKIDPFLSKQCSLGEMPHVGPSLLAKVPAKGCPVFKGVNTGKGVYKGVNAGKREKSNFQSQSRTGKNTSFNVAIID